MTATAKQKRMEDLLAKAQDALRRSAWFEAERLSMKTLAMARQEQDFERMSQVVPPLWEARRQRSQLAMQGSRVTVIDAPINDESKIKPGCYLFQPPQVGLDARRLRLAALHQEVPVAVVCREPLTRTKLTPVVAISPNTTLRVKVQPPGRPKSPSMSWFAGALKALGDWAIESLDTTLPVIRQIDALLDFLDALPEHENLHLALEAACREAHDTKAREKVAGKAKVRT